ncbi:putative nucleoside-diphosphate-sugar epimerase [Mycena olivaceomarginata]|nr:putative nucleoside-diphosphate-sugar epimerase [Mycena olivaceomarginata]
MKLIIAGATGFVAQELIRQSLRHPDIKSVVALARRPVAAPPGAGGDGSKLKSVVVKDYDDYPEEVRRELAGADACIWTVAITPSKSKRLPFEEVTRVCQTSTLAALEALHEAGVGRPFRFLYMSGTAAERDQSKTPSWMPEYSLMRGETENRVLAFAAAHSTPSASAPPDFSACVAKPGLITHSYASSFFALGLRLAMGVPSVRLEEVAAAMLQQVNTAHGFEKEPLQNEDLVRIGRRALDEGRA